MKIDKINIDPRIKIAYSNQRELYNFGEGNIYPHLIERAINGSSTGKGVMNTASKFIRGEGFGEAGDVKINKRGETLNRLLRKNAKDISKFNSFALHIKYNLELEIKEIYYIPSSWVRLGKEDSNNYKGKIIIYDNWDRSKKGTIEKDKFKEFDTYNPNKKVLEEQVKKAGGILKYKGQILYFNFDETSIYPLSPFDAVVTDLIVDNEISTFRYKTIRNGFLNINLLRHLPFENKTQEEEFFEDLKGFQGSEEAGSILAIEDANIGRAGNEKGSFVVDELKVNINDKLFETWINTTKLNITQAWNVPDVFINYNKTAITNQSGELIKQATIFLNNETLEYRDELEDIFNELMSKFTDPVNNLKIQELSYKQEETQEIKENGPINN